MTYAQRTKRALAMGLLMTLCHGAANAQTSYSVGGEVSASAGRHEPLWLHSNKHGLSSLSKSNGYLRMALNRPMSADSTLQWDYGYGADVALTYGGSSTLVVQQAYAEGRWRWLQLTAGSKEWPMELKNQQLSTGSQTLGINARPVPQIRLWMPGYVGVPYTKGWLAFKFHGAFGVTTDDGWQRDFTQKRSRYTEHTLYHSKALFVRIGPGRINFKLGLEMGCQFAGTSHMFFDGKTDTPTENEKGVKALLHALTASGTDATDGDYKNSGGNHVGNWTARLDIDRDDWNLGLYADQMFEDNSMMVHVAYNGWGEGPTAYQHSKNRYFVYDFKDGLLGAELKLKRVSALNNVVLEFMATKYQGGPTYHDITTNIGEHITGRDNYCNHNLYTGWQHWGQVMGNPLFMAPLYNDDGSIEVRNNRFIAWHLGVGGTPLSTLSYRVLLTWQRAYGTYDRLLTSKPENVMMLAEATYRFAEQSPLAGWKLRAAVGADRGQLYGNNTGVQIGIVKEMNN